MHRDALISIHTHSWFGNKVIEGNLKALFLNQYGSVEKLGTGTHCAPEPGPTLSPFVTSATWPDFVFTAKMEL